MWNCSDLLTRGKCKTAYKVSDIMKDHSFINLYMYQIFSPSHLGRANLGFNTNLVSHLVSEDVRSRGVNRGGISCALMTEI